MEDKIEMVFDYDFYWKPIKLITGKVPRKLKKKAKKEGRYLKYRYTIEFSKPQLMICL